METISIFYKVSQRISITFLCSLQPLKDPEIQFFKKLESSKDRTMSTDPSPASLRSEGDISYSRQNLVLNNFSHQYFKLSSDIYTYT